MQSNYRKIWNISLNIIICLAGLAAASVDQETEDRRRLARQLSRDLQSVEKAIESTRELIENGLFDLLRKRSIWPHSGTRWVTARVASPVDAALLDLPVGAPLLAVTSVMQDRTGTRIETSEQVFDARDYTMELSVVES